MAIIVYYCLANMQCSLANEIFEFLPAAMRWNLEFLSVLERIYLTYMSNSRLEGIRQTHHPTCAIWDGIYHDRKEAWLQTPQDNTPQDFSPESALAQTYGFKWRIDFGPSVLRNSRARLVRPGVWLNLELGQLGFLSEVHVSLGSINMIPGASTGTTSQCIKVQSRCNTRATNGTRLPFFPSCRINASQRIGLTDNCRERDKPLHELDEGRAGYKAPEQERR